VVAGAAEADDVGVSLGTADLNDAEGVATDLEAHGLRIDSYGGYAIKKAVREVALMQNGCQVRRRSAGVLRADLLTG
jgi:hypothetical protein